MLFSRKILALSLGVSFFLAACSSDNNQAMQMPPQPVTTILAKAENLPLKFTYPAKIVSEFDAIIKPQVSGVLKEKLFKAGDLVKKGDVLFIIEQDKFKAALNAAIGKAQTARATFDSASQDYARNQILIEKEAISKRDFENSTAAFQSAKANLQSARAEVQNAKLDLDYSAVKAPFDGVVGDALINVGEYVSASVTQLVRVTNLNPIYADFYISDVDKINISRHLNNKSWDLTNFKATLDIANKQSVGNLYFVDTVIDDKTGSVKAKAIFDNNDSSLIPGAFGTISTEIFAQKNGFKIPRIALMQDQRESYVYTIKEGKVAKNAVNIVYQNNDFIVVSSGVNNGDKIITSNFKKIRPGADVMEVGAK